MSQAALEAFLSFLSESRSWLRQLLHAQRPIPALSGLITFLFGYGTSSLPLWTWWTQALKSK